MSSKLGIGIIGCGKISDAYFAGLRPYPFLEIVACADLLFERAERKAAQHGVRALSIADLLAEPDIAIVINLTVPQAHAAVNESILRAGKHAYCEKPFALNVADGARVLALARERGLLVGCAPDTFLGSGLQTARALIDQGAIGTPLSAMAHFLHRGHETWHPAPEFYYQAGGGPMFDMGPYYLTALVNFLGPIARVGGIARRGYDERTITSQPQAGKKILVEVPTHYFGTVEFAGGAVASLVTSFDTYPFPLPRLVVFGTEGTLEAPDPNHFHGDVRLYDRATKTYVVAPPTHAAERLRGTGVADMARAVLRRDRSFRASGELAQHIVEAMCGFDLASITGRTIALDTTCARPAAFPAGLASNELDS
ncbi:MAG: Gfo/Idh/MocA family oxidoreductase [Opitutaceae bacterium]